VPIPIICPGCGWTENGPEGLAGKRLKCKICKQSFVVGGGPVTTRPNDLDFGEVEERPPGRRRRRTAQKSIVPVLVVFLFSLVAGGGAAAGYLWGTKPAATSSDDSPSDKEKPANFTWIPASSPKKSKDAMDLPFDENDLKGLKAADKKRPQR
jgi:hypothetical protein